MHRYRDLAASVPAIAVPTFESWDEGTSRVDLASRKEIKFTFDRADVGKLRRVLETRCTRVTHNCPVSVVRSIYFDDPSMSACHANLNGLGQRTKVRLRWYDSLRPKQSTFLEVKWRENRITGKHRLHLNCAIDVGSLSYKQLHQGIKRCLPDRFVEPFERYRDPAIIVQYNREHFVTPDRQIRITLDYALQFYSQAGKMRISTSFATKMEGFVVLEGKTPIGSEWQLRHLLYPLARRAARCSKYVHGCQLLGLVHDGV
jgi:hypothetical protein